MMYTFVSSVVFKLNVSCRVRILMAFILKIASLWTMSLLSFRSSVRDWGMGRRLLLYGFTTTSRFFIFPMVQGQSSIRPNVHLNTTHTTNQDF